MQALSRALNRLNAGGMVLLVDDEDRENEGDLVVAAESATPEAIAYLQAHGILFAPAKASNAGGVATSGLEMSQNSLRLSWTFEEVDERLHNIMVNIYHSAAATAEKYGMKGNLVAGANIAGFEKIASAMMSQGIV